MWNASNFAETSLSRSVSVLLLPHQSQNTFHLPPASLAEIWNDQDSCLVSCSQEVSGFECLVLHQSWYRENVYFCPPSSFRFSFQEMQIAWQSLRNIKTFKRLLSFSYLFLSFFFHKLHTSKEWKREPPAFDRYCHKTDFMPPANTDCEDCKGTAYILLLNL